MYHRAHRFAIVVIIAAFSASVWAAPPAAKAPGKARMRRGAFAGPNRPEPLFRRADAALTKGDRKTAATLLGKAATALRVSAGRFPKEDKAAVSSAAADISKLAKDIAKVQSKQMRLAFARADLALGRHSHRAATQAWAKKQAVAAGMQLIGATMQVEHASFWLAHKKTSKQVADNKNARMVGQKLARRTKVNSAEVDKALKLIGSELQALSGMIKRAK